MLLWENIVLAINSLLSNKMRALLTMLGIIIGIGAVIAIVTVGDSLILSVSENMQSMGANDIYAMINPRNEEEITSSNIEGAKFGSTSNIGNLTDDDYITNDMVKELCQKFSDEIYAVNISLEIGSAGQAEKSNNSANISLYATTAGYFVTNKLELLGGHMFSESEFNEGKNVAIVSDKLVNKLFDGDISKAIGSEISVNANDQYGNITIVRSV